MYAIQTEGVAFMHVLSTKGGMAFRDVIHTAGCTLVAGRIKEFNKSV